MNLTIFLDIPLSYNLNRNLARSAIDENREVLYNPSNNFYNSAVVNNQESIDKSPIRNWNNVESRRKSTQQNSHNGNHNLRENSQVNNAWKKKLNITFGTAKPNNSKTHLSADIELAVFGVAKDASPEDLVEFMSEKGMQCKSYELLTKHAEARTNTYRIVIAASDYEKATLPESWPYRVGVRLYKRFSNRTRLNWKSQSNINNAQNRRSEFSYETNLNSEQSLTFPNANLPVSNRFSALSDDNRVNLNYQYG